MERIMDNALIEGSEQNNGSEGEHQLVLSDSIIGIRLFKLGPFTDESLGQFRKQVETIKSFDRYLKDSFKAKSPRLVIITNSDIDDKGSKVLEDSGVAIVQADKSRAERRAKLGKRLIGEKSLSRGDFSYADMLNSLNKNLGINEGEDYLFISSDLTSRPEALASQIAVMKTVYDRFQVVRPDMLAIVGSMVSGTHDPALIEKLVNGTAEIDLENLNRVFPNNALSLVPSKANFSGISDNALAGEIQVDGQLQPIGGNEDFLYGLTEMIL